MALRPCENSCQRDGGCFWVCLTLFWPVMLVLAGTFAYLGVTFLKNRVLLGELWKLLDAAYIVCAHNGDRFDLLTPRMFSCWNASASSCAPGPRPILISPVTPKRHVARCVGQRLAVPSRICQDRFHFER